MSIQQAYNEWSSIYDTNSNKTRDLEAIALREMLGPLSFQRCLEIGCGSGKNTVWLATRAGHVTAVDFSAGMLQKAKEKVKDSHVIFHQADVTHDWTFVSQSYDLVTFSLVLEHIENLDVIFQKTSGVLIPDGYLYIGELHPFKQYAGSKARFETEHGRHELTCYTHHISDFISGAKQHGLELINLAEYFDKDDNAIPRVLSLLMRKGREPLPN